MYLRGAQAVFAAMPPDYTVSGAWGPVVNVGADPDDCRARGGIARYIDRPGPTQYGAGGMVSQVTLRSWYCDLPASGAGASAAPAPANVTTSVSTAVSPQISPVFVQQSNPSNSPVGAATGQDQSAKSLTTPGYTGGASIDPATLDYLKARDAASAANDAALIDAISAGANRAQDTAPVPQTTTYVPADPIGAPAPTKSVADYVPYIALAGFGVAVLSFLNQSKRGRKSRRRI